MDSSVRQERKSKALKVEFGYSGGSSLQHYNNISNTGIRRIIIIIKLPRTRNHMSRINKRFMLTAKVVQPVYTQIQ